MASKGTGVARLFYLFCREICHIGFVLGWRVRVFGRDRVPRTGPLIVAANHRSFADPPLVGVCIPRELHFLAKKELFAFRPFGALIAALNAHPLDRAGDIGAFRVARRVLEAGGALMVFPEGRRMKSDDFGPPKAGVGLLAKMTKAPVLPVYVHNSGHMKGLRPLFVQFGSPIPTDQFESTDAVAKAVMAAIADLKAELLDRLSRRQKGGTTRTENMVGS